MIAHQQTSAWKSTKLGDLVSFKTGKLDSNAAKPEGEYPFFTCSRETFRTDTYSFDTECVLLAGNNANGVYPIKYYSGKFDAYQRTYVIRTLDEAYLSNRYLYYALQPKLELLKSISTGAATKFLTLTLLRGLNLEVPPLSAQHKIVSVLSAYDDLIENNTRRIEILQEMAQAIYREWFVNFRFPGHEKVGMVDSELGPIPERWQVQKLGELVRIQKGKKARQQFGEPRPGTIPYLLIDGLKSGDHIYTDDQKLPVADKDDVVMVMDGASSGMVFIGSRGAVGSTLAYFRPQDKRLLSPYILHLFLGYHHRQIADNNVGSAIPHANKDFLNGMDLTLPPESINREAHQMFASVFTQVRTLQDKNVNLRRTRDLLLPKLISGEVNVEEVEIGIGDTAG